MNVTFQSNRFSQNYNNRFSEKRQPSFTAVVNPNYIKGDTSFYAKLEKHYENFTDLIARNVIPKIMDNQFMGAIAEKFKGSKMLYNHFAAVGSAITSGLYMYKTLDNDKLDKDRKQTLAINQGLTFGISTIGAYALDKSVDNWWQKIMAQYAGIQLGDNKLAEKFKTAEKGLNEFIKEQHPGKLTEQLAKRLDGMNLVKKMFVFGMVYRYLVPVLVTPIANKIGEHRIAQKKAQEAQKTQKA